MSAKNFKNISFKFKIKTFKQKKELMSSIISPGKYQEPLYKNKGKFQIVGLGQPSEI